jgi:hypothetical protein
MYFDIMASTVFYDGRLAIGDCMTSDEGDDIEQDEAIQRERSVLIT